jgi:hypothetical protein
VGASIPGFFAYPLEKVYSRALLGRGCRCGGRPAEVRFWNAADGAPIWRWFEVSSSSALGNDPLVFSSSGRSLLLERGDEAGRRYTVSQPVEGDPRRLELWAQVLSRRELSDVGDIRDLDAEEWADRRRDLDALGGPLQPP